MHTNFDVLLSELKRKVTDSNPEFRFCSYFTIYSGNRLPPFYIGSSNVDKIAEGYRGSVSSRKYKRIWNLALKEEPELFETFVIERFETREEASTHEFSLQKEFDVIQNDFFRQYVHGE